MGIIITSRATFLDSESGKQLTDWFDDIVHLEGYPILYKVCKKNQEGKYLYGVFDGDLEKVIIPPNYIEIKSNWSYIACCKELSEGTHNITGKEKLWGVYSPSGNIILPVHYDSVVPRYGAIEVSIDNLIGFYSYTGKMLVPVEFVKSESYHGRVKLTRSDGKTCVYDSAKNWKCIIPLTEKTIHLFEEEICVISTDNRIEHYDYSGNLKVNTD